AAKQEKGRGRATAQQGEGTKGREEEGREEETEKEKGGRGRQQGKRGLGWTTWAKVAPLIQSFWWTWASLRGGG
ncbi:MAG: hypothetical protein ACKPKO_43900, partial [Candidatus Fonsibacter sp.]